MGKSLSRQLIALLTTVLVVELFFLGLSLVIGQSILSKIQEGELREYVTDLPPLTSQSLILHRLNGNEEAFEFLIYEVIQSRRLDFAGFFTKEDLERRLIEDPRYEGCSNFFATRFCAPTSSAAVFGLTRLDFEGKTLGYVLQEASSKSFTSNLNPSAFLGLGVSLAVAFVLNIVAVLLFFRRRVSKDLHGIRKLINRFDAEVEETDLAEDEIKLTEFHEIASTLQKAHELRKENARTRDLSLKAQTMMATVQMIAHDVRRPFSLLALGLESIGSARSPVETRAAIEAFKKEVHKGASVVNGMLEDLLEIGRTAPLPTEPLDLRKCLIASLREVSAIHCYPDVDVSWELDGNVWTRGHAEKLERVFSNIFANALEATDAKTFLSIGLSTINPPHQDRLLLTITNTNSTIFHREQELVFELFHSRNKPKGTGLGLAIARTIIEKHSGSISCTSRASPPSVTFRIELPAAPNVASSAIELISNLRDFLHQPQGAQPLPNAGGSHLEVSDPQDRDGWSGEEDRTLKRDLRVFVVDDDPFYRDLSARLFDSDSRTKGRVSIELFSSLEEFARSKTLEPDVLLCDLNFHAAVVSADTLASLQEQFPMALLILHSDDEWSARQMQDAGFVVLSKPLAVKPFLAKVEAAFGSRFITKDGGAL